MGAQERAILKGFFKDLLEMHDGADVVAALAEANAERKAAANDRVEAGAGQNQQTSDYSNFLKISDSLQLVRFRGPDFAKLVGRTPAHSGNPPICYEIRVDKTPGSDDGHTAVCLRNERELFTVHGAFCSCLVEQMAVSALKRWWKSTRAANRRSHAAQKRAKKDSPKEG